MAEEFEFVELPELQIGITISKQKGKPVLFLQKKISDPQKIRLLTEIIMRRQYLPCKIIVKDKLIFFARLKKEGII